MVEEDRLDPDPVMEEGVKDLVDLGLEDGREGLPHWRHGRGK